MSGAEVRIYGDFVLKIQLHGETSVNEVEFARFLKGRVAVPEVLAYHTLGGYDYVVMTKLTGSMLCDERYLKRPEKLFEIAARALHALWAVSPSECPSDMSLGKKLSIAERNVINGNVDLNNVNADTFGKGGRFADPEALLNWLKDNRPDEDIVVSHGDLCLPNIFDCNGTPALLDFPYGGRADRFCDIALLYRSCKDNLQGGYGRYYSQFNENLFFDILSVTPDREKIDYYILLDELF